MNQVNPMKFKGEQRYLVELKDEFKPKDYFDGKIFYPDFLEKIVDRRFVSQAISQVGIDGDLSALLTDEEYEKLKGMKEVDTICRMQHFFELH